MEKLIKRMEQMGFKYHGRVQEPARAEMLRKIIGMENVKLGSEMENAHFFAKELAKNEGSNEIAKQYAEVAVALVQQGKTESGRQITLENPVLVKNEGKAHLLIEMIEHPIGAEKVLKQTMLKNLKRGEN